MMCLDPQIESPPFFMPPGHFTMDQMYEFKIDDQQLFFPQAYETEANCCPSLVLSVANLSDQEHISGIQDKRYSSRLIEWDVYWKQDWVLHWLPSNFYLSSTSDNWETAPKKQWEEGQHIKFWTKQSSITLSSNFTKGFLLVTGYFIMKGFSVFLDMKTCNDWDHKMGS